MAISTTKPNRPGRLPGLITALALLAFGCERPDHCAYYGTTKPRHGPDEAWTNLGSEPEWIDPGKCSDSSGGVLIFNLFAGLTHYSAATAPIFFAGGSVSAGTWWKVGFLVSLVNISIWLLAGGLWWKLLGLW